MSSYITAVEHACTLARCAQHSYEMALCFALSCSACAASKVEQIGKLKLFISALQDPERRCVDTAAANHSGTCVYVSIWYIHIYVHTVCTVCICGCILYLHYYVRTCFYTYIQACMCIHNYT